MTSQKLVLGTRLAQYSIGRSHVLDGMQYIDLTLDSCFKLTLMSVTTSTFCPSDRTVFMFISPACTFTLGLLLPAHVAPRS